MRTAPRAKRYFLGTIFLRGLETTAYGLSIENTDMGMLNDFIGTFSGGMFQKRHFSSK